MEESSCLHTLLTKHGPATAAILRNLDPIQIGRITAILSILPQSKVSESTVDFSDCLDDVYRTLSELGMVVSKEDILELSSVRADNSRKTFWDILLSEL